MAKILITGGTGSLGSALARKWAGEGNRITILSRDPHKQGSLALELPGVNFILADICDHRAVRRACVGQDILVHAAALKQIDSGEYHPSEFARVNVKGTQILIDAWNATQGLADAERDLAAPSLPRKALLISTDKAVSSLNSYGSSKALATALFRRYDYSVIRYGNVVESNGAFVQKWQKAIAAGDPITLRTPEPTRFFLTMAQAVELVEDALRLIDRVGNGIFVPHSLRAFSIWDVAKALQAKFTTETLLPYEKRHETLVAEGEAAEVISDKLARISAYWPADDDFSFLAGYRSQSAERMIGAQVLEALKWEK